MRDYAFVHNPFCSHFVHTSVVKRGGNNGKYCNGAKKKITEAWIYL